MQSPTSRQKTHAVTGYVRTMAEQHRDTAPHPRPLTSASELLALNPPWEGALGWSSECMPYTQGVLDRYHKAGFGILSLTLAAEWNGLEQTMRYLGGVRRALQDRSDIVRIALTWADVEAAHKAGAMACVFHFQGAGPFGGDPGMIDVWRKLGVGIAILAYNGRNALGDGCQEPSDAGLSGLGRRFVAEMNRVGMIIDLSHVGRTTAREAIEASVDPCVISHSNPKTAFRHVRNVGKGLMRACADAGGVIGINSLSFMLNAENRTTVADYVDHIMAAHDIVGPEAIALGMDWNFYDPFMQHMFRSNPQMRAQGYPAPPWGSLEPEQIGPVVDLLLARGLGDAAIAGLLRANMARIARRVWN